MLKRVLCPPEVCVGKGSLERLGCIPPSRVLVITSGSARRRGVLDLVKAQLKDATALEAMELPAGEPRAAAIQALRPAVEAFAPEWIVAVGGGAVMDTAKFLWAQFELPELVLSGKAPMVIGPLRCRARLIAVPTTAGSGSEASQAAVLSGDDGAKIPYVSAHWIPDVVILDPVMTVSLPRQETVTTGFDALAHAVESAVSTLGNSLLRSLAATAVRLVLRHLPTAVSEPQNLTARAGMLEAAFWGGLCQSTASTGAAHALSHATSKLHGASHGAATGFYLVPTMLWNRTKNAAVYNELAADCGLADGAALVVVVKQLAVWAGLPLSFPDLVGRSLDVSERQALAEAASKDVCLRTNPSRLAASELAQLLAEIG